MFIKKPHKSDKKVHKSGDTPTAMMPKNKKRLFIVAAALFLLGIILFVAFFMVLKQDKNQEDIAIKVGKTTISTSQYQSMLEDFHSNQVPLVYSDEEYKQFIINVLKKREVAEELGIATSDDAIKSLASSRYCIDVECGDPSANQLLAAEAEIYDININNIAKGNKRVARLMFPCSQHFAAWQEQPPSDFGNISVIEADKVYAEEQAKQFKDTIVNSLNYKVASESVEKVLKDPKLSYGYSANNSEIFYLDADTGEMFTEDNSKELLNEQDLALLANQAKGVTDIYEMNGAASMSGVPGYGKDGMLLGYYLYAVIDSPDPNPQMNETVNSKTSEVKVVTNV